MSKDNRAELKPCPFCGCKPEPISKLDTRRPAFVVDCENCGVRMWSINEHDLVEEWNTREVTIDSGTKSNKCYNEECGVNTDLKCQLTGGADKCGLRMDEPMEDSGADVCEWEDCFIRYTTSCDAITSIDLEEVNDSSDTPIKYCPYCGKPITIKGE